MIKTLASDKDSVEKTASMLRDGGVVIIPTDTVYGIGCAHDNSSAIEKIISMKGRDKDKRMALLVSSIAMAEEYVDISPKIKIGLMEVWPGPFTGVFQKKHGGGTEGIRVPNHAFVKSLIDAYGKPVLMTSANMSGSSAHTHIMDVMHDFGDADDSVMIVDGGDIPDSMASTVVDFTEEPPKVLRIGPVSDKYLQEVFKTSFQLYER